jgi:thiamine-monophosphate kinase
MLLTADMLVEGTHFDCRYIGPRQLGRKAVVANLSDIAAMGGAPRYGLLSLGLREDLDVCFFEELVAGIEDVACPIDLDIVGGDTTRTPQVIISLALVGEAPRPVLRSRGREGEAVYVTGPIGLAAAGLDVLRAGRGEEFPGLVRAQNEPQARLKAGLELATSGLVGAMIDLSDGLARDLGHICRASSVGAVIEEGLLPVEDELARAAKALGRNPLEWVLGGGEDYELLFTSMPSHEQQLAEMLARADGLRPIRVGRLERGGMSLKAASGEVRPLPLVGYDHFRPEPDK